MPATMILTGDINLLGVDDPAVPFRRIADTLRATDVVFSNLECCLYAPAQSRVMARDDQSGYEGFYVAPAAGEALRLAGIHGIGNANNQNYGTDAILASNENLDRLGIPHAGTGQNQAPARAPIVIERKGIRFGFLQRTSQYWPNNHEAQEFFPGVAAMKAYTAYQPPYYKDNNIPPNRPGRAGEDRDLDRPRIPGRFPAGRSRRSRRSPTSWSPPTTGATARTSSTTRPRSRMRPSMPAPTW